MRKGPEGHDGEAQVVARQGGAQNSPDYFETYLRMRLLARSSIQKAIIEMAADRGAFIDQSQSLNIHMADVNSAKLTSMHFFAWKKGLKTGMYYLRTRPKADAIQFTVDQDQLARTRAGT